MAKILIITPTASHKEYCWDKFKQQIERLQKTSKHQVYSVVIDNSKQPYFGNYCTYIAPTNNKPETVAICMNYGINLALMYDYDYIFSLESDVFTPQSVNVIDYLIDKMKGRLILGLPYFTGKGVDSKLMQLMVESFGSIRKCTFEPVLHSFSNFDGNIHANSHIGTGCLMICTDVFKNYEIKFRHDSSKNDVFPDTYFHEDLIKLNVKSYIDRSMVCTHINSDWNKILCV